MNDQADVLLDTIWEAVESFIEELIQLNKLHKPYMSLKIDALVKTVEEYASLIKECSNFPEPDIFREQFLHIFKNRYRSICRSEAMYKYRQAKNQLENYDHVPCQADRHLMKQKRLPNYVEKEVIDKMKIDKARFSVCEDDGDRLLFEMLSQDMSPAQRAARIGMTTNAERCRASRLRKKLRRFWEDPD